MSSGNHAVDLLIRGGTAVVQGRVVKSWIAADGGKIVAIGNGESWMPKANQVIDARGKHVLPGVIDNENHPSGATSEEVLAETRAAIACGITTIGIEASSVEFTRPPRTFPKPDEVPPFMEVLPNVKDLETDKQIFTDYFFTPIISNFEHAREIPRLAERYGITSYKLRLHTKAGEHIWDMWRTMRLQGMHYFHDGLIFMTMEKVAALGKPAVLGLHCENWEIAHVRRAELMAEGRTDPGAWGDMSPPFCEAGPIRTYAYYAKVTGCPILIRHTTCEESFEEIRRAKQDGVDITGNTNTHYLTIDKNVWRTNVPHRPKETFPKIWEAIRTGIIDTVSSDNIFRAMTLATMEEWERKNGLLSEVGPKYPHEIFKGAGEIGRESMAGRTEGLPLILMSEGVNKGRISLERFVEVCCENPARKFGLYPKKGVIAVGADADFAIFDLNKKMRLTRDHVNNSNGWSIWEGWEIHGWPVMTILRGNIMMDWPEGEPKRKVTGNPIGQYLERMPGHGSYRLD